MRIFLINNNRQIRINVIRYLKLLLINTEITEIYI
jgi:hypothetical protein